MKRIILFAIAVICISFPLFSQNNFLDDISQQQPMKIGDEFEVNLSTSHPYESNYSGVVFEREFYSENASYIKLYFENFNLAPGDYLEIYSPKTDEQKIYAGRGKIIDEHNSTISDFWSGVIFSDKVIVKLHTPQASKGFGFDIKKVAYGYSPKRIAELQNARRLAICGKDDKEPIACYSDTEMFEKGKAVCKLIMGGSSLCTGWLLGCEGNVMTNNHCISGQSKASNTDYIFNYRKESCSGGGNAKTRTLNSATYIKTNSSLDYTLLKLPENVSEDYGYLSLSSEPPRVGDRIYIVQHPGGKLKEVVVNSDRNSGYAQVDESNTGGVRYYADTEGGSSGSPVFSYDSNLVIAIHNTGGCTNGSSGRSDQLIKNLGSDMPECGVDDANTGNQPPKSKFSVSVNCNFASFTNNSSKNAEKFEWDFGDGNSSTEQNPTHTYAKSGEYVITLTVTNEFGTDKFETTIKATEAKLPSNMTKGICEGSPATVTLPDSTGDYVWYNDETSNDILATGKTLEIEKLDANKTFYVAATGDKIFKGTLGIKTINRNEGGINNGGYALVFDAQKNFILHNITVYAESQGTRTLELKDSDNKTIKSLEVTIPTGESVVNLNLDIPAGNDLKLGFTEDAGLFRTKAETGDLDYPYNLENGLISIKSSTATSNPTGYYYYTYNWDVSIIGDCVTRERAKIEVKLEDKPEKPTITANKTTGLLKVNETYKNYNWYYNGDLIPNAKSQTYTATKEGAYYVEVSNVDGCNNKSDEVILDELSTTEFELPKTVSIYPSPATNILNLNGLDSIAQENNLEVFNIFGQLIQKVTTTEANNVINVSQFNSGIYFLRINNRYVFKFVKN